MLTPCQAERLTEIGLGAAGRELEAFGAEVGIEGGREGPRESEQLLASAKRVEGESQL